MKDLRIQGIGECVLVVGTDDSDDDVDLDIDIEQKVSLSNIRIQDAWTSFNVKEKATLWMTDCVFSGDYSELWASKHGRLELSNVQFIGCSCTSVIWAREHSSISAVDCLFDECGGGDEADPSIRLYESPESVSLHLVGNVFKNLPMAPIGGHHSERIKVNENAIFRNNRIGNSKSNDDVLYTFTD